VKHISGAPVVAPGVIDKEKLCHLIYSQLVKCFGFKSLGHIPLSNLALIPSTDSNITGSDVTITCWLNGI
jgi:hypothetical protein